MSPLLQRISSSYARAHSPGYSLVSWLILRALGLVFVAAFASLHLQLLPLLGSGGLLPIDSYIPRLESHFGGTWEAFRELPSIFYWGHSDATLRAWSLVGLIGSILLLLGCSNALLVLLLWAIYFSFVSVGQLFYSYGWESQILSLIHI